MAKSLVMVLTVLILSPLDGRAQAERPIVAVFPIEAKRVKINRGLLDLLADQLATGLAASGRFQVVPRDDIKKRLVDEKKASFKGCYDQSCQVELGRELAAQKTLATQIGRIGKTCTVTAALFDLRSAATEDAAKADGGCDEEGLLRSINAVITKLTKGQQRFGGMGMTAEAREAAAKDKAPKATGKLSRDAIRRVIAKHRAEVKACYERSLVRNPDLQGLVTVRITVGLDGHVSQAFVKKSTIGDDQVGACIVGRIGRWVFPRPEGGLVHINYPFRFKNAS